ncbi:hypothetical protein [Halomarina ordinaria]|uniref:Uncharacterized protein n=1 Tax=Halomarina ordinaria TaxID=3033939 RepID=A0ABD5U7Z0_9EURY|nr:hypothetical protein [Halomarina sp. PSRA2]
MAFDGGDAAPASVTFYVVAGVVVFAVAIAVAWATRSLLVGAGVWLVGLLAVTLFGLVRR